MTPKASALVDAAATVKASAENERRFALTKLDDVDGGRVMFAEAQLAIRDSVTRLSDCVAAIYDIAAARHEPLVTPEIPISAAVAEEPSEASPAPSEPVVEPSPTADGKSGSQVVRGVKTRDNGKVEA